MHGATTGEAVWDVPINGFPLGDPIVAGNSIFVLKVIPQQTTFGQIILNELIPRTAPSPIPCL